QKLIVRCLLNLDEVRHLRHFLNFPEKFPYALATCERLRHRALSVVDRLGPPERLSRRPHQSRPSGQAYGLPDLIKNSIRLFCPPLWRLGSIPNRHIFYFPPTCICAIKRQWWRPRGSPRDRRNFA